MFCALSLLGGQIALACYLAFMDVLERGVPPVFGEPEWLFTNFGIIAMFGSIVWLTWHVRLPSDE
ncbi:MAG TPA: hypothetical protein VH951_12115 [Dehalococcoidia bacterium]|jgi:hypothetical protein